MQEHDIFRSKRPLASESIGIIKTREEMLPKGSVITNKAGFANSL